MSVSKLDLSMSEKSTQDLRDEGDDKKDDESKIAPLSLALQLYRRCLVLQGTS